MFLGFFSGYEVYLALFVDDGMIAAKSAEVLSDIVKALSDEFEITLGDCTSFVRMQICRNRFEKSMFMYQSAYTKHVIEKFGMSSAKGVSVPADPQSVLYPIDSYGNKYSLPYREAVGSLMFLEIVSRPDISYAVHTVSKFLNKHNNSYWQAVKRIISYLVGTVNMGLEYRAGGAKIEFLGYSDAELLLGRLNARNLSL